MKRTAGALVMAAALSGCVATGSGPGAGGSYLSSAGGAHWVPGVQGPWGQPVAMAAPYTAVPPNGEAAAREMMARSVPLELMQTGALTSPGAPSGIMLAGGPGAVPPPPGSISAPGMPYQPFVAGAPQGGGYPPGAVAAVGAIATPQANRFPSRRTEVSFAAPYGMKVSWYAPSADGRGGFASNHVDVPGRYNFVQGAVYRLKLTDIPNRPGVELYPTLEVVPSNLKTDAFLAHSAVPVTFTNEDLDQVAAGNYLVKVVYLPDPQFQDLAVAGPEEVVSSRLEPGVDPIAEAYRRGSILLVIRLGNIDLELANSPAMDAPGQYQSRPAGQGATGHAMLPGMPGVPASMGGMMLPGGPMMGGPGMQMPTMIQPGQGPLPNMPSPGMQMPTMTQPGQGALPNLPVPGVPDQSSKLSETSATQQTRYAAPASGAQLPVALPDGSSMEKKSDKKPVSHSWWWGGESDKK